MSSYALCSLNGHKELSCVAFTPDGRRVAFAGRDTVIRVHDIISKNIVCTMKGHTDWIVNLAVTSDGQHLVSVSTDETARVWLMQSGANVRILKHQGYVRGVVLSPDCQLIVTSTGYPDSAVCVWRMADGSLVSRLEGHTNSVHSVALALSPDGLHIVSGSYDETARVWLLADGALQREIPHPHPVLSVAVTSDSQHIVTGCWDCVVRLFLLATGELVRELKGHTEAVWRVAVSASGRHVVSGSRDNTVSVWSLADAQRPLVLSGHTSTVLCVAFHPNSKQVASASFDSTVRLWTVCEWSDRDHQLFGDEFKALIFHLMCVKARLERTSTRRRGLPRLPMAVWLQIFASFQLLM